ncbi:hypothetical protein V1511DRAFT_454229 [Dipodascopsis uninucleata]
MHSISFLIQLTLYGFTASVLLTRLIPQLRYLLQYGKTLPSETADQGEGEEKIKIKKRTKVIRTLFKPFAATVPKRFFVHFYIVSVLLSAWSIYMVVPCTLFKSCSNVMYLHHRDRMVFSWLRMSLFRWLFFFKSDVVSLPRASTALIVLFVQSARRWYECLYVEKMSNTARIRVGHYVVGIMFYVAAIPSVWCDALEFENIHDTDLPPSGAIVLYIFAAMGQFLAHQRLSQLKKYSPPPPSALFQYIVCPHYTCEILVYVSIAWMCNFSKASISVLAWTTVNLCASAEQSRAFYVSKFGEECVAGRWNTIPLLW